MNLLFDTYFWLVSTGRDIRTVLPSITSVLSNLHNNPWADLRNFFCSPRCQKGWTALIYFIQVCKKLSRSSVRFEVLSFSSFVCRGTFLVPCVQFWMQAKWTFLRIELNFFPKRFSLLWCNVQREKKILVPYRPTSLALAFSASVCSLGIVLHSQLAFSEHLSLLYQGCPVHVNHDASWSKYEGSIKP